MLLFALKCFYPARIFLIRGNHESRHLNEEMEEWGFHEHIMKRFEKHIGLYAAEHLYETIHDAFDWLPLAAVIDKKVLVLHGGIGSGNFTISDLAKVRRPMQDYDQNVPRFVHAVLWSDPTDSDHDMAKGVHPNPRGDQISLFGPDVTQAFCRTNKIDLIVRSHQLVPKGFKHMHGGRLITLFSARNYFESYKNDGALLLLAYDEQGRLRVRPKRVSHRPLNLTP